MTYVYLFFFFTLLKSSEFKKKKKSLIAIRIEFCIFWAIFFFVTSVIFTISLWVFYLVLGFSAGTV